MAADPGRVGVAAPRDGEAGAAAPELPRAVGRWAIVGLSVNDVIGSGVYLLPAAAAALMGPWSSVSVLVAGLAVGLLVLCFAEASSYFDQPGGAYLYTREAFGGFVGFEVGWMTWLARIASVASLLNGFTLAMSFLWPGADNGVVRVLVMAFSLGALTWINVVGVGAGVRTAVAFAVIKTVPLALFIVIGVFYVDWRLVAISQPPDLARLGETAMLLLFAYAGFENTPAAAGEYKDPKVDVPVALVIATLIIATIYCSVQVVSLGTLPGLASSSAPLADASLRFMGSAGAMLVTIGAAVSILGNVGNTTLLGPRYLFALAVEGLVPSALARVHPRYRTPHAAIMLQSALALALALTGSFVQLATLSVVARLATYAGTAASVPVLRRRFGEGRAGFRIWGGPIIPAVALLLSFALLATANQGQLLAAALALGVGGVVYLLRRGGPVRGEAG